VTFDLLNDDDLATCVHCGLCLDACPTFRATGLETESPRGRIYLMTQWKRGGLEFKEEQVRHIDLCLGCRTCEAVCPSGVPYGRIIEAGRAEVADRRRPSAKHAAAKAHAPAGSCPGSPRRTGHPRAVSLPRSASASIGLRSWSDA